MKKVDRLLAALQGMEFDRIPFTADLSWWYDVNGRRRTPPEEYCNLSLVDIAKDIGIMVERYPSFYKITTENVEKVEQTDTVHDRNGLFEKRISTTIFKTPVGKLRETKVQTFASESQYLKEHPVKSLDVIRAMRYILDHSSVEQVLDDYLTTKREYGDNGSIQMVLPRSPIQRILIEMMGYNNTFIALRTHPMEVEELMFSIEKFDDEVYRLAEKHPAKVWEFGENIHSEITNPVIFRKYNMPYYEKRVRQLHAHDKILYIHIDGYMRTLLPLLKEMEFDAIQGFAPRPQGDFTIAELRDAVKGKIVLWGGIPANILCGEFSDQYVERFILETLKTIEPGDRFVFGIGDMLPPNGYIQRVRLIERLLEQYGRYPISIQP